MLEELIAVLEQLLWSLLGYGCVRTNRADSGGGDVLLIDGRTARTAVQIEIPDVQVFRRGLQKLATSTCDLESASTRRTQESGFDKMVPRPGDAIVYRLGAAREGFPLLVFG